MTFEDYKRIYQAANEIGIVGQTEINERETQQIWKNVLSKKKGQQQFFEENISDIPVCDFTDEEIGTTMKIRSLSAHDRRILLSLLDAMHQND